MTFLIRLAQAPDIPAMHRIRNGVRQNRLSDPNRITEASYRPFVAAGSAWVAEVESGVVGFALVEAQAGRVEALFVHPDAEGGGIGSALHRTLLRWAHEQGIRCLRLSTESATRAEHFYARKGWISDGAAPDGEVYLKRDMQA